MKLLIFTEHKDTLDYLAADGKDGRPLGKLREWGLKVTQIHGGMKIGDRDTPGTRIYAEREFREERADSVATEAAGEGINLQFCWLMINYDIPWNPVRLEQRMGRIHRYGQEHNCLIFNFAALNTREGRVLQKLLERLSEIRKELGTDHVFDVVGEVFPSNLLEKLFREMYAKRTDLPNIEARIVREVDADRFRKITNSTLEGLAKRELNLGAIVGKSAEARERRLIPEVIEDFFTAAGPISGVNARPVTKDSHVYVLPVFANRKIATINREMVQKFLAEKAKNYSRSSLRSMRVTIGLTLKWAAACGWIDKNPCTGVRLPVETGGRKVNRTVLSAEQINSIAENLEEPYATFILFLAVTGLRISEAMNKVVGHPMAWRHAHHPHSATYLLRRCGQGEVVALGTQAPSGRDASRPDRSIGEGPRMGVSFSRWYSVKSGERSEALRASSRQAVEDRNRRVA